MEYAGSPGRLEIKLLCRRHEHQENGASRRGDAAAAAAAAAAATAAAVGERAFRQFVRRGFPSGGRRRKQAASPFAALFLPAPLPPPLSPARLRLANGGGRTRCGRPPLPTTGAKAARGPRRAAQRTLLPSRLLDPFSRTRSFLASHGRCLREPSALPRYGPRYLTTTFHRRVMVHQQWCSPLVGHQLPRSLFGTRLMTRKITSKRKHGLALILNRK